MGCPRCSWRSDFTGKATALAFSCVPYGQRMPGRRHEPYRLTFLLHFALLVLGVNADRVDCMPPQLVRDVVAISAAIESESPQISRRLSAKVTTPRNRVIRGRVSVEPFFPETDPVLSQNR